MFLPIIDTDLKHKLLHVIVTITEFLLANEGTERPDVRAQIWRSMCASSLYMAYKIQPFSTQVWRFLRY